MALPTGERFCLDEVPSAAQRALGLALWTALLLPTDAYAEPGTSGWYVLWLLQACAITSISAHGARRATTLQGLACGWEYVNVAPGERVAFRILRDERERTIRVELTERPQTNAPQESAQREAGAAAQFGLALSAPTEAEVEQLELEGRGLLVQGVRPGSEAAEKGLRPGDVILEAGGRDLVGLSDFEAAVEDARARDRRALLVFVVSQNGQRRYAALEMPSDETEEE